MRLPALSRVQHRLKSLHPDFQLFLVAVCMVGFSQAIMDSTFNNFLHSAFGLQGMQRAVLELPRELPGFLVVFVSGMFFFLCSRRLAAVANCLAAAGMLLIGHASTGFGVMLVWLFVFSTGQHLFLPLFSGIGMELAENGRDGRRLGQLQGAMNLAAICGSFLVMVGFSRLGFSFAASFTAGAAGYLIAGLLIALMTPDRPAPLAQRFVVRREYARFYWLTVLYGTRKQLFLTFVLWVLATVYGQPTQAIAGLLTVGGLIGIVFKPLLGRWIDRFGERTVLTAEAVALIVVCLGYGFAATVFGRHALAAASACYIGDQLLMSVSMARATYLKKIARDPADVTPTLTMATTIDHVFSIAIALVSGAVWVVFGYRYVFALGAALAAVNVAVARGVRTARSA